MQVATDLKRKIQVSKSNEINKAKKNDLQFQKYKRDCYKSTDR